MSDGIYDSKITSTELESGTMQYDIDPLDGGEHVTVFVDETGEITIHDEDGEYSELPGEPVYYPSIDVIGIPPLPFEKHAGLSHEAAGDTQVYLDLEHQVRIEIGFDEGDRYVNVDTRFEAHEAGSHLSSARQSLVFPEDNESIEIFSHTVHESDDVMSHESSVEGEALMTPGGQLPPPPGQKI